MNRKGSTKATALFIFIALLMQILTVPVSAEGEIYIDEAGNTFGFAVNEGTAQITSFASGGITSEITVPETVYGEDNIGFEVISIGPQAFENKALTKVVIPESVIEIGDKAFKSNTLTSVRVLNSEADFGIEVFDNSYDPSALTIYGYADSTAEEYATTKGHNFLVLDGGDDTTAPTLTAAGSNRTSDSLATVRFSSDEGGTYYYKVVEAGETQPEIDIADVDTYDGTDAVVKEVEATLILTVLTSGEKDIYIVVRDAAGNVCEPLKISIPAYVEQSDYIITKEGFNYKVDGSGTFSFADALNQCTDLGEDGKLLIQLGTTETPLEVTSTFEGNILKSATYCGYINISGSEGTIGFLVPEGEEVRFKNLRISYITPSTNLINNVVNKGKLYIEEGSEIRTEYESASSAKGNIKNEQSGELFINGGTIFSKNDMVIENFGSINMTGGTVETNHPEWVALRSYGGTTLIISGGQVKAPGVAVELSNSEGSITSNISGGEIITTGDTSNSIGVKATAFYVDNPIELNISGGSIIADNEGLESMSRAIDVQGGQEQVTVNISGGEIINKGAGYSSPNSSALAIRALYKFDINISDTAEIEGARNAIYVHSTSGDNPSTINISGGSIESKHNPSMEEVPGFALMLGGQSNVSVNMTGGSLISGTEHTVRMQKSSLTNRDKSKFIIDGKEIYGRYNLADVVISGENVDDKHVVNIDKYGKASLTTYDITSGNKFVSWTSDNSRSNHISIDNPAVIDSLISGGNNGVESIYLNVNIAPGSVPVAPSDGFFTVTDTEEGEIAGTISWTAPTPSTDILGYRIYWGDNEGSKLNLAFSVVGGDTTEFIIPDDTQLPTEATCLIVYSYELGMESDTGLVLVIEDNTGNGDSEPDGSGTEEDPYKIESKENLLWISENNVNENGFTGKYFELASDIVFEADDFEEGGDLYNDGKGWKPIGHWDYAPFTGSFDGSGHTITGLNINRSDENAIGLFGYTEENAVIKNIGLENIDVKGNYLTGALVGWNKGSIENTYATGTLTAASPSMNVGGLVGNNSASGSIIESHSAIDVAGHRNFGGLVGENSGEVKNSYSTGNVTSSTGYDYGGFIGINYGTIENCYATGNVTGRYQIGGLVGQNLSSATIKNSYSTGLVKGIAAEGGLAFENQGTIENCFWNTETSVQISGITFDSGTSTGVHGKNTAQMKLQSTYIDGEWVFSTENVVWSIDESQTYPYLKWQDADKDLAPSVYSDTYPKTENATSSSVDLLITMDEASISYYVVLPAGGIAPEANQIKAGKDGSGNNLENNHKGSISLNAAVEKTVVITGLDPETNYDLYVVAEDYVGNLQPDSMVAKVEFTTLKDVQSYDYTLNDDRTITITGFEEDVYTELEIPETIDGVQVTQIGDQAFLSKGITSVVLPEGLTHIGTMAFQNNAIVEVTIPDSVTNIGMTAFSSNNLAQLNLGNGVVAIEDYAFEANGLTSIVIPDSLKSIGVNAFNSNELTTVSFGDGLESIGEGAFRSNNLEMHINIPEGVTTIGKSSFAENQLTSLNIPDSVKTIGDYAFGNNQLERIAIGKGLESIGADAFNTNCLSIVEIPDNVMTIGDYAFAYNQDNAEDLWIIGYEGSSAEVYAEEAGHSFVPIPLGEGTAENPYEIKSPEHLLWISISVGVGDNFYGKYFEQMADIDMSTVSGFEPIGSDKDSFEGKYDGKEYKIINLTLDGDAENDNFTIGLFGVIGQEGEVKNLVLEDISIDSAYSGPIFIGGIAGMNYGRIIDCHIKVSVEGESTISASGNSIFAGGIAGYNIGEISMSSNSARIEVGSGTGGKMNYFAGGIAAINGGLIENSFNAGSINAIDEPEESAVGLGGIAGLNTFDEQEGQISFCYNTGELNISGSGDNKFKAGIGSTVFNPTQITDSFFLAGTADCGFYIVAIQSEEYTPSSEGAWPKTEAELKNPATFNNWDVSKWKLKAGSLPSIKSFVQNTYTVTYNGNGNTGGSVPTDSQDYEEDDIITVLGNTGSLTKIGYTFAGWNTSADGSGTTYTTGQSLNMGSNDVILYAMWTAANHGGGSSRVSKPTPPPTNTVPVTVDGKSNEQAATVSTQTHGDKTMMTVTLDTEKLTKTVNTAQTGSKITVPITGNTDVAVGELNGQLVKLLETKEAVVEINTDFATYSLPVQEINIDGVSAQIGQNVNLTEIKVSIEIEKTSEEKVKIVEDSAEKGKFIIVAPPIDFKVKCTYNNKTVEVNNFNRFVERTVAIPDGVDPTKITTGVIVESDGTIRHVPTQITVINGKYYAKINSLTNSTYSVIWNPKEFKDVAGHWAKDAVNDMGSRLVISGVGDNRFDPDRVITRAEFAAIIVRALGLSRSETGESIFKDVIKNTWYYDAVSVAHEYGIISGYGDGDFGPTDQISREQAMAMIARAMKITGLKVEYTDGQVNTVLASFVDVDQVASYAKDSIAACVKAGIVSGRGDNMVAPKDHITRAEVAVMVQRLLQKSNLI